jgi:hypothetical protein
MGHAHAAETECRDLESSKFALVHADLLAASRRNIVLITPNLAPDRRRKMHALHIGLFYLFEQ